MKKKRKKEMFNEDNKRLIKVLGLLNSFLVLGDTMVALNKVAISIPAMS